MKALEKLFPAVTELLHFYEGKGVKARDEKPTVFFIHVVSYVFFSS